MRPASVNVLGKEYSISYVDSVIEVDMYHREALWGQIDYWTRSIRVYVGRRCEADILDTLLHEVLHAILEDLNLDKKVDHDSHSLIAMALADVLMRNGWVKTKPTR